MQVDIRMPGGELLQGLHSHIQRHVRSRMGRLAGRVRGVSVRISEFCGDERGAVLTCCRIEAEIEAVAGASVAEALDSNPYRAIDGAMARLTRSLHRNGTAAVEPIARLSDASSVRAELDPVRLL